MLIANIKVKNGEVTIAVGNSGKACGVLDWKGVLDVPVEYGQNTIENNRNFQVHLMGPSGGWDSTC